MGKAFEAKGTACAKAQRSGYMVWLEVNSAKVPRAVSVPDGEGRELDTAGAEK